LTGVDHIERNDAFRPELLEPHAIACAECIGDLRRDAEQYWGKVEQSAARTASAALTWPLPASDFFEGGARPRFPTHENSGLRTAQ
jgi:hypothetical protein